MSEENWEQKYKTLKREREEVLLPLLRQALGYVPAEDSDEDPHFINEIAPSDSDLPIIMRLCDPEERQQVIELVKSKIIDGKWTGNVTGRKGSKRPTVPFVTKQGYVEQAEGKRKAMCLDKRQNKAYKTRPVSTFIAAHAVLLADGRYPTEQKNTASHLCHNNLCVEASHLVWESHDHNQRRERKCHKTGVCSCNLTPGCMLDVHK